VAERLAGQRVSNLSELARVVQNTGLRFSPRMKGYVDEVKRINERKVTILGWLADPEGDATPLNVLLYASGVVAGATQTEGDRPDVTQAQSLSFSAEKHVSFSINSNCKPDDQLAVVGITATQQYTILELRDLKGILECVGLHGRSIKRVLFQTGLGRVLIKPAVMSASIQKRPNFRAAAK
jgi:hypothetical protein